MALHYKVAHLDSWGLNPGFKAKLDTHLSSHVTFPSPFAYLCSGLGACLLGVTQLLTAELWALLAPAARTP